MGEPRVPTEGRQLGGQSGGPSCSAPRLSPSLLPSLPAKDVDKSQDCALPVEEAGIIWDSICFIFLLLQRRVFLSCYFLHVWADLKASALQASRWAGRGKGPLEKEASCQAVLSFAHPGMQSVKSTFQQKKKNTHKKQWDCLIATVFT